MSRSTVPGTGTLPHQVSRGAMARATCRKGGGEPLHQMGYQGEMIASGLTYQGATHSPRISWTAVSQPWGL